jgi:hypothetical protein
MTEITTFLTPAEIKRAMALYKASSPGTFAAALDKEIITPNLARINKAMGQENNSRYLAYVVEYVLSQKGVSQ